MMAARHMYRLMQRNAAARGVMSCKTNGHVQPLAASFSTSTTASAPSKNFIGIEDLTPDELRTLITDAHRLKQIPRKEQSGFLVGQSMAMIFEKPSLRTHSSFNIGMIQLGGSAFYLGPEHIGLGSREPIKDVANVLSRMADIIIARVNKQRTVLQLAEHAVECPVINALDPVQHPCQTVADLLTILETKERLDNSLKVTFVGDGNNNVTHSLAIGCGMLGINFAVAAPKSHKMDPSIASTARDFAAAAGSEIVETTNVEEAVAGSDFVYCDTFVSMGESKEKASDFDGYQVTSEVMSMAASDASFMHDMPAYRGVEVTADVIDGPQSIIYHQASNRLHGQKALVLRLLGVEF